MSTLSAGSVASGNRTVGAHPSRAAGWVGIELKKSISSPLDHWQSSSPFRCLQNGQTPEPLVQVYELEAVTSAG